jgi:cellulose synthase operon protein C
MAGRTRAWIVLMVAGMALPARAQDVAIPQPPEPAQAPGDPRPEGDAFPLPDLAPAVTRLMAQPYLTADEQRALRLRHGTWTDEDLTAARDRARAALVRGAFWDASLDDPDADPVDRAEAMLMRGEALLDLGRADDATQALLALVQRIDDPGVTDADELAEAVRGLVVLARLTGAEAKGGVGYQRLLTVLGHARDDLDRLSWRVSLAEAMLLYEKGKYADTGQALESVLTLNPRCAQAWSILGRAAVDGFDFPRAERIAARLDLLAGEGGSPAAAVIRAAARLRQTEGEAAEKELSPWLERFASSRELLAWHAAAAAARFDFDGADARLAELDRLAPGTPRGYLAVGRAMAEARQYDQAARYLREAAARAPLWADPAIELGMSQLQAGQDEDALAALELAASLDRYHVGAANSLKLVRELQGYAAIESDHFIVRYKPGIDQVLAAEMPPVLERLFTRVTGLGPGGIAHAPAHKTVVELYPDHHWFSVRITGMPELHTIAAATGPVIAMEAPREGPGHKAGPYDWARVVQHEYTHTVTLSRTRNRLPHWFTEAGAVFLEDAPRDWNTVQLLARSWETGELFDLDEINVGFVRPRRPSDRALAYAQGHWMYEYILQRWGNDAPLKMMDLYASGVREEQAFQQVLGLTRAAFLTEWKAWAGEQLERWGVRASDATPDIPALLKDEPPEAASDGPTPEMIDRWLAAHPANPFVLEAAVRQAEQRGSGKIIPADAPLCERYAAARPVDPRPHKLLAALYLSSGAGDPVPHLEWLDAREQHSPGFAVELSRRYAAAGDMTRAQSKAARAVYISPYDARIREFAATIALRAKDTATAERHLRALLLIEPDRPIHQERLDALLKMKSEGQPR